MTKNALELAATPLADGARQPGGTRRTISGFVNSARWSAPAR
jgi:hypothetical protein